jgi:hypothetical protein
LRHTRISGGERGEELGELRAFRLDWHGASAAAK